MADFKIPHKKFKKIGGIKVSYLDEGKGEMIFCLPPWPSPSLVFVPLIAQIGKQFRIISPDMPGWLGESQKPVCNPDLKFYTQLIEDFIKSFGINKISLLGYSYGGVIAQQLVYRDKSAVKRLVLVSSPFGLENIYQKFKLPLDFFEKIGQNILPEKITVKLAYYLKFASMLKEKSRTKGDQFKSLIAEFDKESNQVDARSILLCFSVKEPMPVNLEKIRKIPVLLICGGEDDDFVNKDILLLGQKLGKSPVILEGADHTHLFFDAEKSAPKIADFFAPPSLWQRLYRFILDKHN